MFDNAKSRIYEVFVSCNKNYTIITILNILFIYIYKDKLKLN